jgi:hypothetical protein
LVVCITEMALRRDTAATKAFVNNLNDIGSKVAFTTSARG